MPEKKVPTRRDLEDVVVKRALTDEPFRNQLMKDPKGAVEKVLAELEPSARLPQGLEVMAIQEPQHAFNIVIPHARPATELSDAELDQVAGGLIDITVSVTISPF